MEPLERLAPLFTYPDDAYVPHAQAAAAALDDPALAAFAARVGALTTTALQERFIETFDLNAACTLEIGWHLFGEHYERGEFLVRLRGRLREAGIPESGELPDHLQHVLPLVARFEPQTAAAFVDQHLAPALERIAGAMPADNPFSDLLHATLVCARAAGPAVPVGGPHD